MRQAHLPVAIATVILIAATLAISAAAYPVMFTGFEWYDDEGYMLFSLQSFLENGNLYDQVPSNYGPFFYQFWGNFIRIIFFDYDKADTS